MRPVLFLGFLLGVALAPNAARSAESQGDARLRDALRSVTSQLRALEEERTRWQATEAEQKKEIESLKAEVAAQSHKARTPSASPELTRRLAEQIEANQKLTDSLAQCQSDVRAKDAQSELLAAQSARMKEQVSLATNQTNACDEKNAHLYRLSHEILDRCEKMGPSETLLAPLEPLIGLRRTRLENLSQDFEDKLLEQKVQQ